MSCAPDLYGKDKDTKTVVGQQVQSQTLGIELDRPNVSRYEETMTQEKASSR